MDVQLHNFPNQRTSFVGRQGDISATRERLQYPDCRLLTIVGAGGMGKTRLAQEVARLSAEHYADGVYFVPLAGLSDANELIPVIGHVLGLQFAVDSTPIEVQLSQYLRDRKLLLVLDNFEHIMAGVEPVSQLLNTTSEINMLVTSREALNLQEEWVHQLEGLSIPEEDVDDPLVYTSVQLFATRAEKAKSGFDIHSERDKVCKMCDLVAGMPLAIEIAASWLRTLTTEQVLAELQQGLDVLTTTMRNVPDRHRSVRVVFDHSWKLLLDSERDAFMKMCVFRGGFTLQAVRTITGATLLTISSLVAKSLLSIGDDGRYTIHELLRQYGLEQLEQSGQLETVRNTHTAYFLQRLAEQESKLKSGGQIEAIDLINSDFENIKTAWAWAIQQQQPDVIDTSLDALYFYTLVASRFQEGERLLRSALDTFPEDIHRRLYGRLLARAGVHYLEPASTTEQSLMRAREIADDLDDDYEMAHCDYLLGMLHLHQSDIAESASYLEAARDIFEREDYIYEAAHTYFGTGWLKMVLRDWRLAHAELVRCKILLERLEESFSHGWTLLQMWSMDITRGVFQYAESYLETAYNLFQSLNNREGMTIALASLAYQEYINGNFKKAIADAEKAIGLAQNIYSPLARKRAHTSRGIMYRLEHNPQLAYEYLQKGREILREQMIEPMMLSGLAVITMELGKEEARQYAYDALRLSVQSNSPGFVNLSLGACICTLADHYTPQRLLEISLSCLSVWGWDDLGEAFAWLSQEPSFASTILPRMMTLSQEEMMAVYARRDELDMEDIAQEVLNDLAKILGFENHQDKLSQSPLIEDLTERESEVLSLIIEGLTNAEIAEELVVGVSTVKKHINNLYSKLGVSHRTQAIARARELRLM